MGEPAGRSHAGIRSGPIPDLRGRQTVTTTESNLPPGSRRRRNVIHAIVDSLALAIVAVSLAVLVAIAPPATYWLVIVALTMVVLIAERFPLPSPDGSDNVISFGPSLLVGTTLLVGWQGATVIAYAATIAARLVAQQNLRGSTYNASMAAVATAAAGATAADVGGWIGDPAVALALEAGVAMAIFTIFNVCLIAPVIANNSGENLLRVLVTMTRFEMPIAALLGTVALTMVVLWQRAPFLVGALAGPLAAIYLHLNSLNHAAESRRLALTDPLTGLGNRRALEARLVDVEEQDEFVSVLLIDFDDFKAINDDYGHDTGDRALRVVGDVLRDAGEGFRLGGDEFAVILPQAGLDALATAHRIVESVHAAPVEGLDQPLSVSIGVAERTGEDDSGRQLMTRADEALYEAKERGKRQAVLCRDAPQRRTA